MSRCSDCAGPVVWNEDASSNICTSCGTLSDPSQRVLTTNDPFDSQYFTSSAPNVLKRFRGGSSWNLAGQSKELRVRSNTYAIHEFIKSLSRTLSVSGLSPRVCTLFDQAMRTNRFRWGAKAKLVAAACLSIALRESGHPDSLKDIAFLIEQSDISIKRTLSSVLAALNLTLTSIGPVQYLPTLQSYLSHILQSPVESSGLAISLYSELKLLSIRSVTDTARLFIDTLARFPPETSFSHLSPAAVACAVFIVSLEAEKRGPLSHLADISACFAKQFQVAKKTVMQRYEALQEIVAKWTKEVEWLDSYDKSGGRTKISKRLICARGLRDALNWKHSLWEKRIEAEGKLLLNIVGESESEYDSIQHFAKSDQQPSRKRRKVPSAISHATRFLLDPGASASSEVSTPAPDSLLTASPGPNFSTAACTMSSYLLSVSSSFNVRVMPSRLQQLSVARGGAGSDVIEDHELFADGEWENIQRTPEEMQQLEQRWRDEGILEVMEKIEKVDSAALKKRKSKCTEKELQTQARSEVPGVASMVRHPPSKRINLEAFSNFMRESDNGPGQVFDLELSEILGLEALEEEKEDEYLDEDVAYLDGCGHEAGDARIAFGADEDEVTVDDWRPASPDLGCPLVDDYYL